MIRVTLPYHLRNLARVDGEVQLQVEGRGFAMVEVLAECPVHLHLTPREAQAWVRDAMVPVELEGRPFAVPAGPFHLHARRSPAQFHNVAVRENLGTEYRNADRQPETLHETPVF